MEEMLTYKREQLNSAVMDFSHSLSIDLTLLSEDVADAVRNGQVQKFEFTIELLWKVIKIFTRICPFMRNYFYGSWKRCELDYLCFPYSNQPFIRPRAWAQ